MLQFEPVNGDTVPQHKRSLPNPRPAPSHWWSPKMVWSWETFNNTNMFWFGQVFFNYYLQHKNSFGTEAKKTKNTHK